MKNLIALTVFVALLSICTNGFADDLRKKIVGKWYNPYTYESTGEIKGFHFKKNGRCKAFVKTLDLKKWYVKDSCLVIEGFYQDKETGKWEEYKTSDYIRKVNSDSLYLLTDRDPSRAFGFLYLNFKTLEKK